MGKVGSAIFGGHDHASLRYHLHRHFSRYRPARSHKRVHASDGDPGREEFCPRAYALMDITGRKPDGEWLATCQSVTYTLGHAMAEIVVSAFAEMGMAVGNWICASCRTQHSFQKRPAACRECGCAAFRHREMHFVSRDDGVSCSIDLALDMGGKKLRPVEIKSIKGEDFKKLTGVNASHRWRTALYLQSIADADCDFIRENISSDSATVIYVSKIGWGIKDPKVSGWGIKGERPYSPFKEYKIGPKDADTSAFRAKTREIKLWREKTGGVPHGICQSIHSTRAQSCPVAKQCFSKSYPAGAPIYANQMALAMEKGPDDA